MGKSTDASARFSTNSRYCEVDLLNDEAWKLFGNIVGGWARVQAICDWCHDNLKFGYEFARPTKTASQMYQERQGVCRDFTHLAVTFCRCLNIPARYVTGYLGDIGVPEVDLPMDFSAWFEVYLSGRWWTFDAPSQHAAHWPGADGPGPRCNGCSDYHFLRHNPPCGSFSRGRIK
jgi:transglutaminase-like putative cysteine protease